MMNVTPLDRPHIGLAVLLALLVSAPPTAFAQSAVKLQGSGTVTLPPQGPATFNLAGTASHLGTYVCFGELSLSPGPVAKSFAGNGVAVFRAANGDLLVGLVTCQLNGNGIGNLAFHWQNSVRLSNGNVVANTGRFVNSRPPTTRYSSTRGPATTHSMSAPQLKTSIP